MSSKQEVKKPAKAVSVAKKQPTKTARKKVSTKGSKTATKKTVRKKVAKPKAIKKVAAKTTKKSPRKTEKSRSKGTSKSVVKNASTKALLIPSPYRFPIDVDALALKTARYGGLALTIMGAVMTIFFANQTVFSHVSPSLFVATAVCSNDGLIDCEVLTGTASNTIKTVNASTWVTDSAQSFDVDSGSLLKNNTRIKIAVEGEPNRIYLEAKENNSADTFSLGRFTNITQNAWEIYVDGNTLVDGSYSLAAVAEYTNEAGETYLVTLTDTVKRKVSSEVEKTASSTDPVTTSVSAETVVPTASTTEVVITDSATTTETREEKIDAETTVEPENELKTVTIEDSTDPAISITFPSETLTGSTEITVIVADARYVELYARPVHTGTPLYLGLPKQTEGDAWTLQWGSESIPNGTYVLQAKVRTEFGFFVTKSELVKVYNETTNLLADEKIETYKTIATAVAAETKTVDTELVTEEVVTDETGKEKEDQSLATTSVKEMPERGLVAIDSLLLRYRSDLASLLDLLSAAERTGDTEAEAAIMQKINVLKGLMKSSVQNESNATELATAVDDHLKKVVIRTKEDVRLTNELINKRTGISAETDSDKDGITDFDEVTLFKTDPNVADSDGDGFIDGAEILNGYDPTDSTPEVAVRYESPKDAGVVREDIVKVNAITTEKFASPQAPDTPPVAVLTGTGLPNSYVTLYIFSTPVVVTVKTEADGSWVYRFDRELEDGEHVVYAGITDNAGKIIAKSSPLSFVKTAEAYEQTQAPIPATVEVRETETNILSSNALYLVASISIVAIGVVLIMIGLHLEATNRRLGNLELKETATT